jgi:DNA-binding transcriptional LysR family regulator
MDANPTLDQLQVFIAVAEHGGFSAAARKLNRSQSVISYTIANLEAQLQVSLFERKGTRQPRLTEAGSAMLEDSRRVVAGLQGLRAKARGLSEGLEGEISLAVDVTVPDPALIGVLKDFQQQYPSVGLHLHVGALGAVFDLISARQADIGIAGQPMLRDDLVIATEIGTTAMVPVAAPGHPLAKAKPPVPLEIAREHVQLVVTDLTERTRGKDFGVVSFKTWRLTDIGMKHALILAGLGWGGLPASMVHHDLAAGRLVALDLPSYPIVARPLFVLHHSARPPGPATRWMIERFRERLISCAKVPPPMGGTAAQ